MTLSAYEELSELARQHGWTQKRPEVPYLVWQRRSITLRVSFDMFGRVTSVNRAGKRIALRSMRQAARDALAQETR